MDVILLQRIEKLGQMGDTVRVKDGYARNFLLPQNKALRASKANQERFDAERVQLEARNLEQRDEAQAVGGKLDGSRYIIIRQAGEAGQLYGSVSTRDVAGAVSEGGTSVARGQIILDRPIKSVGLHDVRVSLHPEVTVTVVINVARSQDEAERQARGEAVGIDADEMEDSTIEVGEVFEDEDLAELVAEELGIEGEEETPPQSAMGSAEADVVDTSDKEE